MSENYSLGSSLRKKLELKPIAARECCRDTHNLSYAVELNNDPDKIVLRCKHCGAIHRRMYVEPGRLGVKM